MTGAFFLSAGRACPPASLVAHSPRMTFPPAFWNNLLIAASLGLAVGVSLWLIRRSALGQRLRVSAGLAVVGLGVYLAELGLGSRADDPVLQVTLAFVIMVSANTLLQLFDWLFWDYLLGRRRHVAVPRLVVDLFNFLVLAGVAVASGAPPQAASSPLNSSAARAILNVICLIPSLSRGVAGPRACRE